MINILKEISEKISDALSSRPDEYTIMEFQARGMEVYDLGAET